MNRGVLTAGGNAVHRVTARGRDSIGDPEARPRVDSVPVIERYMDLAAQMHRTFVSPRGDRFLWGCICGHHALTAPGISAVEASHAAAGHVIRKAQEMHDMLEPKDED